jgi:septum formation protein
MASPLLVLASTSPRRIDLLREIGLNPRVLKPDVDETPLRGEKPVALVSRLCRAKAESVVTQALRAGRSALIISADTIVVSPTRPKGAKKAGKILNKPRTSAEAAAMLRSLAGREHTVLTGYCALFASQGGSEELVRVVQSRVRMRPLSPKEIARYVATGEPMDKAGAYAAQGKGMALIEEIKGSYTNVVGLPVCQLMRDLEEHFGFSIFSGKK